MLAPAPFIFRLVKTFGMLRLCSVITSLRAVRITPRFLATLFAERWRSRWSLRSLASCLVISLRGAHFIFC